MSGRVGGSAGARALVLLALAAAAFALAPRLRFSGERERTARALSDPAAALPRGGAEPGGPALPAPLAALESDVSPRLPVAAALPPDEPAAVPGAVTGRVLDASGAPLPGVVALFRWDDGLRLRGCKAVTDAGGRFRLEPPDGVGAGSLEVRSGETAACAARVLDDVRPGAPELLVEVGPPRAVRVELRDPSGAPVASAGSFALSVLRAGRWIPHPPLPLADGVLPAWSPPGGAFRLVGHGVEFRDAEYGPFDSDALGTVLVLEVARFPHLRGVVTSEGEPLPGAIVRALWPPGSFRYSPLNRTSGSSGADGSFDLPVIGGPTVRLWVRHPVLGETTTEPAPVDPARDTEGLVVELGATVRLEGVVRLPAGLPPEGLELRLFTGIGRGTTAPLSSAGRFTVERLAPGAWHARVVPVMQVPSQELLDRVREEAGPPIELQVAGVGTQRVELDFSVPVRFALHGRVSLAQDLPEEDFERAHAVLECGTGFRSVVLTRRSSSTDLASVEWLPEDGRFDFVLRESGPYRLAITPLRLPLWTFTEELELRPGGDTWSLELRTALLRVHGVPDGPEPIELVWRDGDREGRGLGTLLRGELEEVVPAGDLELRPFSLRGDADGAEETDPPLRVHLSPGEIVDVEWNER